MIRFVKTDKNIIKRVMAFGVIGTLILSLFSGVPYLGQKASAAENNYGLSDPVLTEEDGSGTTTWDSIYFGHYLQEDTNGDGTVDGNDEKQPIKWRVLSVDGDDAFLMADQGLDCKKYNETRTSVTWETCTLRSWLNGYSSSENVDKNDYSNDNFIKMAFTAVERSAIKYSWVLNDDNPSYGTDGGNSTLDRIYLLSIDDVTNSRFGFYNIFNNSSATRNMIVTNYVRERNDEVSTDTGQVGLSAWWLRSPAYNSEGTSALQRDGSAYEYGVYASSGGVDVRPVLHLNLSNTDCWSYAGKVSSDKRKNIHDPQVAGDGTVTWDCVYFGNYYQNDTNGDGTANMSDSKQPIKWRVLSVSGNDAFLMADQNLDCGAYNETDIGVTWETCTLRSWLNGYSSSSNTAGFSYSSFNFINTAFTTEEKSAIYLSRVENKDNSQYGTEGGNTTWDKVYLLSIDEASNQAYGFNSIFGAHSKTRVSTNTTYTAGKSGTNPSGFANNWWLRSPGHGSGHASLVRYDGCGYDNYGHVSNYGHVRNYGHVSTGGAVAVRPVLHLKLSSSSLWSYGGTVSVKDSSMAVTTTCPAGSPFYGSQQKLRSLH